MSQFSYLPNLLFTCLPPYLIIAICQFAYLWFGRIFDQFAIWLFVNLSAIWLFVNLIPIWQIADKFDYLSIYRLFEQFDE